MQFQSLNQSSQLIAVVQTVQVFCKVSRISWVSFYNSQNDANMCLFSTTCLPWYKIFSIWNHLLCCPCVMLFVCATEDNCIGIFSSLSSSVLFLSFQFTCKRYTQQNSYYSDHFVWYICIKCSWIKQIFKSAPSLPVLCHIHKISDNKSVSLLCLWRVWYQNCLGLIFV